MKKSIVLHKSISIFILILFFFTSGIYSQIVNTGNFVVKDNGNIVLHGDIKNDGTMSIGQADFIFSGSTSNQNIEGTVPISFYNVTINKSFGYLVLNNNIGISNNLSLNNGCLDLVNSVVDLGTTGQILLETETNRIKVGDIINDTGIIQSTKTVNAGTSGLDPGNIGVLITTDKNLGEITITRGHQVQNGMGNIGIARWFEVPGMGYVNSTNYVELKYFEAELDPVFHPDESALKIFQTISYGGSSWWTPCNTQVEVVNNQSSTEETAYDSWVEDRVLQGLAFSGIFTISSETSWLPVELLNFNAQWQTDEKKVSLIDWYTTSEQCNDHFIVERSYDTKNWEAIIRVEGEGNSNTVKYYSCLDDKVTKDICYYRLKQVDFDGKNSYSKIKTLIRDSNENTMKINIYPNPATEYFQLSSSSNISKVDLYNEAGQLVRTYMNYERASNTDCTYNISDIYPGIYFVTLYIDNNGEILTNTIKLTIR